MIAAKIAVGCAAVAALIGAVVFAAAMVAGASAAARVGKGQSR